MTRVLRLSRLSPLLLLAAALVALAVFFVNYNAPPASADHTSDEEVWSGTLTVQSTSSGPGCDNASATVSTKCSTATTLTDNQFTYLGVDYRVNKINYANGVLSLSFDKNIPQSFKDLILYIGGVRTSLADADVVFSILNPTAASQASVTAISAGDTVQLKLLRNYWTGVDLYGGGLVQHSDGALTLDIFSEGGSNTFLVRLTQAPTANVTVTLKKNFTECSGCGKEYHGDVNAATVSPTTLTFTPSNWQTGQTVRVTGVPDSDTHHEHVLVWAAVSIADTANANDPYRNPARRNGVWVTIRDGSDAGNDHSWVGGV